jgi:hypothetical protein
LVPVAYAGVAVIGFIWALMMRAARPEVYQAIGRGADGRVSNLSEPLPAKPQHADPVGARSYHY